MSGFGLNISDAHSCVVLLPPHILQDSYQPPFSSATSGETQLSPQVQNHPGAESFLEIGGYSSLSEEIVEHAKIYIDSGLIGWVAKHNRAIHVSPFEHDSRTLGIYQSDQKLKSFLGLPITLSKGESSTQHAGTHSGNTPQKDIGVLAVDSKKSFAFSKLQAKLLEDLTREIARIIELNVQAQVRNQREQSWDDFMERACTLGHSLGALSLEIMRIHLRNFDGLERSIGTMKAIELTKQTHRLIQQTLPPLYPTLVLPNGDIIVAIDTMMSALIENKVRALVEHLSSSSGATIDFEFIKNPLRKRKERSINLETLIVETAAQTLTRINGEERQHYEYRRAQ